MTGDGVQLCTRCVMDTSDPGILFDDNGLCSHCQRYDSSSRAVVESANRGDRAGELARLVATIKDSGRGKPYDCVVGVSGGVDSSYLIRQAVKFGLRPLAVHFDSGWNSPQATQNIENIVQKLGLDLVTDVVNWTEMQDLQLAFFRASVANCDTPTDFAFPAIAFRQAAKHGIKFILSGSNLATESILPKAWGYNSSDAVHLKDIHRRFGTTPLRTYPSLGLFKREVWYSRVRGIRTVKMLNYMPYVKDDAKATITAELDWQDYGGKHHESVFTRYFQGYYLPTKFGFDKRRAHLSSLINSGQMTRVEALEELSLPPYDQELREQDHLFIAEKLGLTAAELDAIVAAEPVSYREYRNQEWLFNALIGLRTVLRRPRTAAAPPSPAPRPA